MALSSRLRKFALTLMLSPCAFLLLFILANQIEQRIFRRHAELLLSKFQTLELRRTTWQEAQFLFQRWRANLDFDETCLPQICAFQITMNEPLASFVSERNLFVKLDDYFRWRLRLSYSIGPFQRLEFWLFRIYLRVGGRPSQIRVRVGMRNNVIWTKGIWVSVETYSRFLDMSEYALIAEISSGPRFGHYGDSRLLSQLMSHPNYAIGSPDGCEICLMGWVRFTPYASPEDVHRLAQLDFSCLTRWHPCTTQSDIMPIAWEQYTAELSTASRPPETIACSPLVIEILGRDSANIATAEVVRYRENFYSEGYDKIVAGVRVIECMKGMTAWKSGQIRDVTLLSGTTCAPESVRVGSILILYGAKDRPNGQESSPKRPWPAIPVTDTNLNLIRRGIDQDYSAADETN